MAQDEADKNPEGEGANEGEEETAGEGVPPVTRTRTGGNAPAADDTEDEMVQLPKSTLDGLLKRLDKLEDETEVLREASDKVRLSKVEQMRGEGKLVKNARVTVYEGKKVMGWKMTKDEVRMEGEKLVEEQTVKLFFKDKSTKEIPYRSFVNNSTSLEGEVIEEKKTKEGQTFVVLQLEDGEEVEISTTFIN